MAASNLHNSRQNRATTPAPLRAGDEPAVEITEYTDPFCSWAWSSEPKLRRLRLALGEGAGWRIVLGILFDDLDVPESVDVYRSRWAGVVPHTSAPLPSRLEWTVQSSWPAARAVKAAALQGEGQVVRVLRRLRESLFIDGRPAGDRASIAAALAGLPGLDLDQLLADLDSPAVAAAVQHDFEETRRPAVELVGLAGPEPHPGNAAPAGDGYRYRFPTLKVAGPRGVAFVPGWRPYDEYLDAVRSVSPTFTFDPDRFATAGEALDSFGTLTHVEIDELAEVASLPSSAARAVTASGAFWRSEHEASARSDQPVGARA